MSVNGSFSWRFESTFVRMLPIMAVLSKRKARYPNKKRTAILIIDHLYTGFRLLNTAQQRFHIRTDDRMNPARINIAGGLQNKAPFMKPRMRDGQPWAIEDTRIVKQDVEIENSRPETNTALRSSHPPLNVLQDIEQDIRIKAGFQARHTVHEPVLIQHMHGRRPVEPGNDPSRSDACLHQTGDAETAIGNLVSKIRSKTDPCGVGHSEDLCPIDPLKRLSDAIARDSHRNPEIAFAGLPESIPWGDDDTGLLQQ